MKTIAQIFFSFCFIFPSWAEARSLQGKVSLDGSSTVFPISEAMAEEFQKENPKVRVTVGLSGTGGGFKKFVKNEIDLSGASRPIRESELTLAKKNNVDFVEIPVAYDGIAVVVHSKADWIKSISVEQLQKIWNAGSQVKLWSDVDPKWPKKEIKLYGPGTDSGTFDYFTETINGKSGQSRPDFSASEDDNVLVQGVSGDLYSLGYFGFAYYTENKDKVKLLGVTHQGNTVQPSHETIMSGSYTPLARPIFIYANRKSLERPEVQAFVDFYINNALELVPQVGYVPLSKEIYSLVLTRIEKKTLGTSFASMKKGQTIADVLRSVQ